MMDQRKAPRLPDQYIPGALLCAANGMTRGDQRVAAEALLAAAVNGFALVYGFERAMTMLAKSLREAGKTPAPVPTETTH